MASAARKVSESPSRMHMDPEVCDEGRLRSLVLSLQDLTPRDGVALQLRCFKIIYLCRKIRGEPQISGASLGISKNG